MSAKVPGDVLEKEDPTKNAILCIDDVRDAASRNLSRRAVDFFNSGSSDQITLHSNTAAFIKYRLRSRVLQDVSKVTASTTILGAKVSFPLAVSPAGLQAMAHPDGELATSRACAKQQINMAISSFSNYSVEEVVKAGREFNPHMSHVMQLYTMKDRALQERIIKRAEAAGCVAIFLTADSPVLGVRYNEWRNDFRTPVGLGYPMLERTSPMIQALTHDSGFLALNSDSHSWEEEIPWLRSKTSMQIWIKGVLTAEDVRLARQWGCDGVVVSNHGGRQLDGTPATIDVLAECVEAAEGKIKIHIDGGFRSGADIFKAIALGAECCWIGRPAIWGLGYKGQQGVEKTLSIFYNEFKRCMMLTGCKTLADINKSCLGIARLDGPLARL